MKLKVGLHAMPYVPISCSPEPQQQGSISTWLPPPLIACHLAKGHAYRVYRDQGGVVVWGYNQADSSRAHVLSGRPGGKTERKEQKKKNGKS